MHVLYSSRTEVKWHLDWGTEQEKDQVEERESRQHVWHFRHGSSMFSMLLVHHHHVDHQTHDGDAKQQIEQESLTPTAGTGHRVKFRCNMAVNTLHIWHTLASNVLMI